MAQPALAPVRTDAGIPEGAFPLSAAQRGIWFAQHIAGREFGTGYLRLIEVDGHPYQFVDTELEDRLVILDFRGEPDPEATAQAWMVAEYSAPLDLTSDRLVCVDADGARRSPRCETRTLREIRAVQPSGPYHLLGWSFGGLIAHAIATKLQQVGELVGTVAMLDADTTDIDGDSIEKLTAGGFVNSFGSVFGIDDVPADATAEEAADLIRERLGGVSLIDATTIERVAASFNAAAHTRTGYRRPVFAGDIVYFSATVDTSDIFGPEGWRPYVTGTITNHDIDVTHLELTGPQALPLIARILDDEYLTRQRGGNGR